MELIVKLKQHTPIIHFQWDQAGATLRATELKPKLDRYIRVKYYGGDESVSVRAGRKEPKVAAVAPYVKG